jgi:hypothetical protein
MTGTPEEQIESIPEQTGKPLDEWVALLKKQPFEKHGERVEWLMAEHGLEHAFAGAIAWKAGADDVSPEEKLDAQFSAHGDALRSVYECVVKVVLDLGGIVAASTDHVEFVNDRTFAVARPAQEHVDLGLILPGIAATPRLVETPNFGVEGVTHAVALESVEAVDDELKAWLAAAFAAAARQ